MNQLNSNNSPFEQRVSRQLVEALLFERVIPYQFESGIFKFTLGNLHCLAKGKISSFGRIRITEGSIQTLNHHGDTVAGLKVAKVSDLLNNLPTTDAMKKKLTTELDQTIKLCEWNQQHLTKLDSRRHLSYQALESALDEGHPYHPCFKARTGFTFEDHERYGPEAGNHFQLHWLAIDKNLLQHAIPTESRTFWLAELGETTLHELEQKLVYACEANATRPEQFSFLPIHPWQWKSIGKSLLADLVKHGWIIYLGPEGDLYQATISVRTLVNVTDPAKPNIKLPMNMVNTSSLRTIETHSVCTAPIITQWLNALVNDDSYLQANNSLGLLDEYAGIVFDEQKAQSLIEDNNWSKAVEGQLAVIFRKSLTHETPEAHQAVPFPALMAKEKDQKPFIDPWIEQFGAEQWAKQLIDTVVIPVWHLLVHHGIALEAHGQNMVLVHQNGWPTKVVLRDFHESLEYQKNYLANPDLEPDFPAINPCYQRASDDQYFWMESVEALRELIVDTLFVFNLTEVTFLLEENYSFTEQQFWQLVADQMELYAQSNQTAAVRIDEIPLNDEMIHAESLIKKKLSDQSSVEFHHLIPNPFHAFKENLQDTETLSA